MGVAGDRPDEGDEADLPANAPGCTRSSDSVVSQVLGTE
ncbi:hypothetical protein Pd630_LPD16038 (plasmid) [Rhodococcus opacus PD630]|nr:hypothetical protein Pd630_LPD16038 [Rhodococcus opacus PD630]